MTDYPKPTWPASRQCDAVQDALIDQHALPGWHRHFSCRSASAIRLHEMRAVTASPCPSTRARIWRALREIGCSDCVIYVPPRYRPALGVFSLSTVTEALCSSYYDFGTLLSLPPCYTLGECPPRHCCRPILQNWGTQVICFLAGGPRTDELFRLVEKGHYFGL